MNEPTEHMEKITQGLKTACDDMSTSYRSSVNAAVEATSVITKGCEELSRKFGDLMQTSMERAVNTGKTMMSARSVQEFSNLHNEYMKEAFDHWVAGTGKLSEISARVTQQAMQPVARHANDAMNKAAEKARQSSAA